ncbi:MAG: hypothetical protein QM765_52810 [Myxococcales bacterium]
MRNRLTILGFALLTSVLAVAAGACGGKSSGQPCADEELVCVRGSWEVKCSKFVRGDAEVVPMECCTLGEDAGSTVVPQGDTGPKLPFDAGFVHAGRDAGRSGRDAAHGKYPPLGDCGDGGWPYDVDAGWFYSLFDAHVIAPPGFDDGGNVHIWQCYIDVCNPPRWDWDGGVVWDGSGLWWLFPRDGSIANCGPLGCP